MEHAVFAFFPGGLAPSELIIVGVAAVLLFGQRLPEVGRSLGKTLAEFNKSFRGIQEEFRNATTTTTTVRPTKTTYDDLPERDEVRAPKFQPPPSEN